MLSPTATRNYIPLPIESNRGFPQSFPFSFQGQTYQFSLYVNIAFKHLPDKTETLQLPTPDAFLVVQVVQDNLNGNPETVFLRKVLPELEYEAGEIALIFPEQRVACSNLNGQGNFGSRVVGGIAPRWA